MTSSALKKLLIASVILNLGLSIYVALSIFQEPIRLEASALVSSEIHLLQYVVDYDFPESVSDRPLKCKLFLHNTSANPQRGKLSFKVIPDYTKLSKEAVTAFYRADPKGMERFGMDQFFEKDPRRSEMYRLMHDAVTVLSAGKALLEDPAISIQPKNEPSTYGFSIDVNIEPFAVISVSHDLVIPPKDRKHPLIISIVK